MSKVRLSLYRDSEESFAEKQDLVTQLARGYALCSYNKTYQCEVYPRLNKKDRSKCGPQCVLLEENAIEQRIEENTIRTGSDIMRVSLGDFIEEALRSKSTHTLDIAPSAFGEEDCYDTADPEVLIIHRRSLRKRI